MEALNADIRIIVSTSGLFTQPFQCEVVITLEHVVMVPSGHMQVVYLNNCRRGLEKWRTGPKTVGVLL